jgi:hypothetical protein
MKNNKEDSAALAKHARDITEKLFDALKSLDDLDSMRSNLDDFVKCVILLLLLFRVQMLSPQGFGRHQVVFGKTLEEERRGAKAQEAARR